MILHKGNFKKKKYWYGGFGHHLMMPTPLCNSKLKRYAFVRNWKAVTCKRCLKARLVK